MVETIVAKVPQIDLRLPDGRVPLVFCWGVSSFFGWGVNGLNLSLALEDHPTFAPVAACAFGLDDVVLDPLREARIGAMADRARVLWDALYGLGSPIARMGAPVLAAIANDFADVGKTIYDRRLIGDPSVGVAFVEHATLSDTGRALARDFPLVIAGSSWNERIFRANGIVGTTTVLQGIDTSLFHPAPRARSIPPGKFVVFSGGKLELRKGQDLVMAAFRAFRQRRPNAVLLNAWHSPWSSLMETAVAHPGIAAPVPAANGTPDIVKWAEDNGVPWDSVIAVGATPNIAMPHVIREADVALFPNRAEGGTNLVAMECMACGIPTILSANTGHLDLLAMGDVAIPLKRQAARGHDGIDATDWGESDVEEMVEALDGVWRDPEAARALGLRGAAAMARLDWARQTELLLRAIKPLLP